MAGLYRSCRCRVDFEGNYTHWWLRVSSNLSLDVKTRGLVSITAPVNSIALSRLTPRPFSGQSCAQPEGLPFSSEGGCALTRPFSCRLPRSISPFQILAISPILLYRCLVFSIDLSLTCRCELQQGSATPGLPDSQ